MIHIGVIIHTPSFNAQMQLCIKKIREDFFYKRNYQLKRIVEEREGGGDSRKYVKERKY